MKFVPKPADMMVDAKSFEYVVVCPYCGYELRTPLNCSINTGADYYSCSRCGNYMKMHYSMKDYKPD